MRAGPERVVLRDGDAFTLVCVPFGGGSARSFTRLARHLPDHWTITAVQPPAEFDPAEDGLDRLARFYLGLLTGDLCGPGMVLGHSLGAAVVHRMVQLHGDWPADLHVVLSAPPPPQTSTGELRSLEDRELLREATARGMLPNLRLNEDVALRFLIPCLRADLHVLGDRGWCPEPLGPPVHLLGGEQDTACPPSTATALRELLRPRTFHLLQGAGHMYVVEEPARTARILACLPAAEPAPSEA